MKNNNQTNYNFTGNYIIKAIYKYQKEVEALISFVLVQTKKDITGRSVFKKQSVWKEDMFGVLEGSLDDVSSKKVKLTLKWYNTNNVFLNQSDLLVTMSEDYKTFEGEIRNMMYHGIYYGTRIEKNKGDKNPNERKVLIEENKEVQENTIRGPRIRKPGQRALSNITKPNTGMSVETAKLVNSSTNPLNNQSNAVYDRSKSPISKTQPLKKSINVVEHLDNVVKPEENKEPSIKDLCIICCEKPKQSVFVPCGHKSCCEKCAEKFVNKYKCPFCKKSVESIIKKVYE